MIFEFIVKRFGFLKRIPLLPQLFDALLRVQALIAKPELLSWLDSLEKELQSWPGVSISMHKYGGSQFNYQGREIAHLHSNGLLDVRYSLKIKQELLTEGRISEHHVLPHTGWVSFQLRSEEDLKYALRLIEISCSMKIGHCSSSL
ncbi:luciferase domain-containing protein [Desertivirga xinjiangensis]|uniref:luciferase domain-containing protein n=1 Tax=Desertivirga xinjiangensis TaxID=539206 RepID=UPI002108853E|nr:luciferase family protein [Pedobacter xinjiangensis]